MKKRFSIFVLSLLAIVFTIVACSTESVTETADQSADLTKVTNNADDLNDIYNRSGAGYNCQLGAGQSVQYISGQHYLLNNGSPTAITTASARRLCQAHQQAPALNFELAKYDEAKKAFSRYLYNQSDESIKVKDVQSWKEYAYNRYTALLADQLEEGVTVLRFNKTTNKFYVTDYGVSLEESDALFEQSNRGPNCAWICALYCLEGDGTCMYMWHCSPSLGCNCLYVCCDDQE